jgi:hypothetical protein
MSEKETLLKEAQEVYLERIREWRREAMTS